MRIELTTGVAGKNVHFGKVTDTRYLDVIRGMNEVSSLDRPRWNETSPISGLASERISAEWRSSYEWRPTLRQ